MEEANYYREVMSFDLKKAKAIFQRLIDKVFKNMIGKNIEVYIDNNVVKSLSLAQHSQDLSKVFSALHAYNLRLNPKKCVFGVDGGKFLEFMLTYRGLEANLEKH